jgi:16S rRNA (cytidine1402-2'-O)-methyltransferase
MTPEAQVYLIPCFLDEQAISSLPGYLLDAVKICQVLFVENERSSRRFLKSLWKDVVIDQYEWFTIGKAEQAILEIFRLKLKEGKIIGILSEAGCPGVADPGQLLLAAAHQTGATIRPLVGPSAILLALMGSGMNGQQFKFVGYLPIEVTQRVRMIRELENESMKKKCTQLFIETPYRNNQLLETLLKTCKHTTQICIASNLTGPSEFLKTKTVGEWKNNLPDLNKQPSIFCMYAP